MKVENDKNALASDGGNDATIARLQLRQTKVQDTNKRDSDYTIDFVIEIPGFRENPDHRLSSPYHVKCAERLCTKYSARVAYPDHSKCCPYGLFITCSLYLGLISSSLAPGVKTGIG